LGGLLAFLVVMIAVDLMVGSGRRDMTMRAAAVWSAIWGGAGARLRRRPVGAGGRRGRRGVLRGYAMEKALSLDNVFVFT
jgi:tellurite resistance protein TerC